MVATAFGDRELLLRLRPAIQPIQLVKYRREVAICDQSLWSRFPALRLGVSDAEILHVWHQVAPLPKGYDRTCTAKNPLCYDAPDGPLRTVHTSRETGYARWPGGIERTQSVHLNGPRPDFAVGCADRGHFPYTGRVLFPTVSYRIHGSEAGVEVAWEAGARAEPLQMAEESVTSKTLTESPNAEINLYSAIQTNQAVQLVDATSSEHFAI